MKKKIAFLFGAGAEKPGYNMPLGQDFMRRSYLDKNLIEDITEALKKQFKSEYYDGKYKYSAHKFAVNSTYKSILKKWVTAVCQGELFYEKFAIEIQNILNIDEHTDLIESVIEDQEKIDHYKKRRKERGDDKCTLQSFIHLYNNMDDEGQIKIPTKGVEDTIFKGDLSANKKSLKSSILNSLIENERFKETLPTGISHILDQNFHTIIDPHRHGKVPFSRIFNYYWSIFFLIYQHIVENMPNLQFSYDVSPKKIKEGVQAIYDESNIKSFVNKHQKSYYSLIQNEFENRIEGVITTNYFKFAEHILKLSEERVAYLNGQLKYFEIPELLEVLDITKEDLPEDKLYFPFILGQSYTKPIVSRYQIEAFYKMQRILDNSKVLIILGYNLNEDDNHINAYLHQYALEKPIIVVSNHSKIDDIRSKLRLEGDGHVHLMEVDYYKEKDSPGDIIKKLSSRIEQL